MFGSLLGRRRVHPGIFCKSVQGKELENTENGRVRKLLKRKGRKSGKDASDWRERGWRKDDEEKGLTQRSQRQRAQRTQRRKEGKAKKRTELGARASCGGQFT